MISQLRSGFPPAAPHGPIEEIFPDIFFVRGSMRMAPLMRISRNMVVFRHSDELVLVNTVRLDPAGEAQLNSLGAVAHFIRLGCLHGLDDPYYAQRYQAQFWCQAGSDHYLQPRVDHMLTEGGHLPIPDAELFVFHRSRRPESAVLIRRHGGVLITCDSLQHYGDFGRHSPLARIVMRLFGFSRTTLVGPLWLKQLTPRGGSLHPDFKRLLQLEFEHLISAHGTALRGGAHAAVEKAVRRAFPG